MPLSADKSFNATHRDKIDESEIILNDLNIPHSKRVIVKDEGLLLKRIDDLCIE